MGSFVDGKMEPILRGRNDFEVAILEEEDVEIRLNEKKSDKDKNNANSDQ